MTIICELHIICTIKYKNYPQENFIFIYDDNSICFISCVAQNAKTNLRLCA